MQDKDKTLTARLCEIQTDLISVARAVNEANKSLCATSKWRPNPGGVERSHQELFDIDARINSAANQIGRLCMGLQQAEE